MTKRKMKDSGVAWIGQVPEGWKCLNLLYVLRRRISDGPHETPVCIDEGIPFISVDSLNDTEDIDFSVVKKFISQKDFELFSQRSRIEVGDILFSKAATIGKTAIVKNLGFMVWSPLAIIKPDCEKSDTKYLYYGLNCDGLVNAARLAGSMNTQANVGMRELEKVKVPLPPLAEQRKIAAFLDGECGKIDVLRGKVEKQIAALEEYRKSAITEAVTKGIKRGRKMKPSGERWCPEIPEGWMRVNAKSLFKLRTQRAQGGDKQLTASQQHGIILQEEFMRVENQRVVTVEKDFGILKHVEPGDFVISMRSFQGGLEYSELRGCISSAYIMLIPHPTKVFPPFYKWFFKSSKYINAIQSTSNLVRDGQAMRYANFAQVPLFEIPISEQREIAAYLDKKCAAIDSMVAKCREELDRLTEYKKSLIYEYVTGKKEVA